MLATAGAAEVIEELPKNGGGFGSQIAISLPSAFGWSSSIAVDAAGDVFASGAIFAASFTSILAELPAVGSGHGTWQTTDIASGSDEYDVAASPSGNVYLFGGFLNILEMSGSPGSYGSPQILPYYSFEQQPFAMDGSKDLFFLSNVSDGDAEDPDYVVELKNQADGDVAQVLPLTGLGDRTGSIAIDPGGNLYIDSESNSGTWTVDEYPLADGAYGAPVDVPFTGSSNTGLEGADPIAVDNSGDVFVVDGGTAVLEMPRVGAGFGAQETLPFTGAIASFSTIGTDSSGDVFAAYSGSVFELPKQGSWYGTQVTATNAGFYGPEAFDSAGNLITSLYNGTADTESVVEYPWNGDGYGASTALGGWSNVYEADFYNFAVDPSGDVAVNVSGEFNGGDLFGGVFEITPSGAAGPPVASHRSPRLASSTRATAPGASAARWRRITRSA